MKRTLLISLLIVVGLLLAVYVVGIYIFGTYFLPNTFVNGKDVSLTKMADLDETYSSIWETYELNIVGKNDLNDKITAKEIDYVERLEPNQHVEQNPFYWFLSMFIDKEAELASNSTYNQSKLLNKVNTLSVVNSPSLTDSQDAKIIFENDVYAIAPEVIGDRVKVEELPAKIVAAFGEEQDTLDLAEAHAYADPAITSDDPKLNTKLDSLNQINSMVISFDFSDRIEELRGERLVSLYVESETGKMVAEPEWVTQYVTELAEKFDTYGMTRDFNKTGGGVARIPGGIYGWQTNIEATTENLIHAMSEKQTAQVPVVYNLEGMTRNTNDIGTTYIEIDIARQHMWLYKEGELIIDTPVVTGNPNQGNGTPTGVGKIWSRETTRYLSGQGYNSFVNYWLPFNWSGCGIHDSSWRGSYGGNIYRSNGSHGCVNTPPAVAGTFFKNTVNGMPVVVYNSSTQTVS